MMPAISRRSIKSRGGQQQPTACFYKPSLTGPQLCPFLHRHFLGLLSHYNGELSCHDRPCGPRILKCLLSIPLQTQLANFLNVRVWRNPPTAPLLVAYIGTTPLNFQSFYFFTYKMGENILNITGLLWGLKDIPTMCKWQRHCLLYKHFILFP